MRYLFICLALVSCGSTDGYRVTSNEARVPPTVTEPGIHISGSASVGVVVSK